MFSSCDGHAHLGCWDQINFDCGHVEIRNLHGAQLFKSLHPKDRSMTDTPHEQRLCEVYHGNSVCMQYVDQVNRSDMKRKCHRSG